MGMVVRLDQAAKTVFDSLAKSIYTFNVLGVFNGKSGERRRWDHAYAKVVTVF
jgi:hypothetical protein